MTMFTFIELILYFHVLEFVISVSFMRVISVFELVRASAECTL